ncbi:MAG: hypothetical protein IPG53_23665 [Ignavibacteriales bacterium]|nr:hypothetical protein [Ignavibacteriales bacterium]
MSKIKIISQYLSFLKENKAAAYAHHYLDYLLSVLSRLRQRQLLALFIYKLA